MIDILFVAVLAFGVWSGWRRGFFRKVIALAGLALATWAAVAAYGPLGPVVAERAGVRPDMGFALAGAGAWLATWFGIWIIGRLLAKKAGLEILLKSAERADRALGASLGLAQAAILVLLVLMAAMALPASLGGAGEAIRASRSYALYRADIEPALATVPQMEVVRGIGDFSHVVEEVEREPARLERLAAHASIEPVRAYAPLQEVARDEEIRKAARDGRLRDVANHPKVIGLLKDPEFRRRLAAIDWRAIRKDIENLEPEKGE